MLIFRALPSGRAARKEEIPVVDGPKPAPNTLPTVRPLSPGRAPGSRRWAAALTHIALARKPSPDASGLLLWARATS